MSQTLFACVQTYYYIEQGLALCNASTTDINVHHPAVKYLMASVSCAFSSHLWVDHLRALSRGLLLKS